MGPLSRRGGDLNEIGDNRIPLPFPHRDHRCTSRSAERRHPNLASDQLGLECRCSLSLTSFASVAIAPGSVLLDRLAS